MCASPLTSQPHAAHSTRNIGLPRSAPPPPTPVCPTSHTSPYPLQPRPATLCSPASTATRRSGRLRSSCCSILGCRCGLSCPGACAAAVLRHRLLCSPKPVCAVLCLPEAGRFASPSAATWSPSVDLDLVAATCCPVAPTSQPAPALPLLQEEAEISDAPFDDTIVQRLQRYGLYGRCGIVLRRFSAWLARILAKRATC